MPTISNRTDFVKYCLRRLGAPVIQINIDDDQIEDRIDDALQYWQDYHFDGLQKVYYIRTLSGSQIVANTNISTNFANNSNIVGATSGAVAQVVAFSGTNNTIIQIKDAISSKPFIVGETLKYYDATMNLQNTSANVVSYTLGDIDARYLDMRPSITIDTSGNELNIVGVTRVFSLSDSQSLTNMFDLRYQLRLNELYDFTSSSYVNYTLTQQHLRSLELMFTGEVPIRFQRHMQRLYIDWAWGATQAPVGAVAVVECYALINPEVYTDVWNDRWMKEYATALIKRTWGNNISKFDNLQLPGGVTLNGSKIQEEAVAEIERLEQEMQNNYGGSLEFFMN
jgi:hypothetical protein